MSMNNWKVACGVTVLLIASACGSSSSASDTGKTHAATLPDHGKIGIVASTLTSEVEKHWTETATAALKSIGWEAVVVDAQNDPGKMQAAINGFVANKDAGIITIAIDGAPIAQALKAAQAANIPTIATGIGIDPSGQSLYSAFYAPSDDQLGQVAADYLKTKVPAGSDYTLLDLSAVYGAHAPIVSGQKILDAAGFKMVGKFDISVADIVGSTGKGAVDLATAHPTAKFMFGCCDFTAPITVPALESAGHSGVIQTVRYDNLSTLALIRKGAPVATAAVNADSGVLTAIGQILAHAATGAKIDPAADKGIYQYKMIDKSNLPADGQYAFDPTEQIATFTAKWKAAYNK